MVGGVIDALRVEVRGQATALKEFARLKVPMAPEGAIFVGAGDSYAAALAGFYMSGGRCFALDPYSLASAPQIAKGRDVYFISVSGKTASNIAAARRTRGVARTTTALTAVESSSLARLVDSVLPLPLNYVPRTPGMLSFGLSLYAVLRLTGRDETADFQRAFRNAKKDSGSLTLGKGVTYLLGNSVGFATALFTAAKAYELLGARAHAELLEEFSHMQIFSLGRDDVVDAFSCFDPSRIARKLVTNLEESGYSSNLIPSRGSTVTERLFHSMFVGQLAILETALRAGLRDPKFLSAGRKLQTSDLMIYE